MKELEEFQQLNAEAVRLAQLLPDSFLELGQVLKQIKDGRLWQAAGCFRYFDDYLRGLSAAVSLDRATIYDLIGIYEDFFANAKIDWEEFWDHLETLAVVQLAHSVDEWEQLKRDFREMHQYLMKLRAKCQEDPKFKAKFKARVFAEVGWAKLRILRSLKNSCQIAQALGVSDSDRLKFYWQRELVPRLLSEAVVWGIRKRRIHQVAKMEAEHLAELAELGVLFEEYEDDKFNSGRCVR